MYGVAEDDISCLASVTALFKAADFPFFQAGGGWRMEAFLATDPGCTVVEPSVMNRIDLFTG